MPKALARASALSVSQRTSAGASKSGARPSPMTLGHSIMSAQSTQCSGLRGTLAMVQMATAVGGGKVCMAHSKHEVTLGRITRTLPRKPSVPPSMKGMTASKSRTAPPGASPSVSTSEHSSEFT